MAVCYLFTVAAVAGDTVKSELSESIKALEARDNFSWTTTIDVPEESRFQPGPSEGSTAGDVTHVTMSLGRRQTHVVIEGDKAAVTGRDGNWETVSLLDQGYRSAGFAASLAQSVRTPVVEANELVASSSDLRREGNMFVGQLSESAARSQLNWGRRNDDATGDAQGTISFWIEAGLLAKYEVRVEGLVRDDDEERRTWRCTTVEIKAVGTTNLRLPSGARPALRRPLPDPEPRMSDEEARRFLTRSGKRNVGVHDPSSIVKCGDEYWFFSTGNGVSSWRSRDLDRWQPGPQVLPDMPKWVTEIVPTQRGYFWAPDVIEHNGRYLLYYSVSSFGVNTSAIALASNPTLDPDAPNYNWTDHGIVIQSSRSDDFNAIDPAVIMTDAGELWMSFGSFWSGLKLVQLDPESGKRIAADSRLYPLAWHREIEAPHIYHHDGYYYLFINWGRCCRGVESTYNIRVGRSRKITGPYVDQEGTDLMDGGGTLLLESEGPFIGPGHASVVRDGQQYWFSCHYYDGTQRGRSMLSIRPMAWAEDGWPVVRPAGRRKGDESN